MCRIKSAENSTKPKAEIPTKDAQRELAIDELVREWDSLSPRAKQLLLLSDEVWGDLDPLYPL